MQDDEAQLIQRAAQRDVTAWSELYEATYDDLYAYAFSRLGSREDAEDIASQVFVEALRDITRFARQRPSSRPRPIAAWLLSIARRLITERQRRTARAQREGAFLAPAVDPGDTEPLVEHLDLLRALKHLTEEQQEAIILRFFLGKTTPEIAAIMGRKENAVFALQFRAVKALRRYIDGDAAARILPRKGGAA